jgi:hypothetical protein
VGEHGVGVLLGWALQFPTNVPALSQAACRAPFLAHSVPCPHAIEPSAMPHRVIDWVRASKS